MVEKKIFVNARFLSQKVSGVQRFAIELSKRMKKYCADVVFVAPSCVLDVQLCEELNVIFMGKTSGHFWEQVELPLFLKNMGYPLLVNLCNTAPVFYKNKISTIHDLSFYRSEWFSLVFRLFYSAVIPRIVKSSKLVFTVSECVRVELAERYNLPINIIKIVRNSVSKKFYRDCSIRLYEFDYILVVGSVEPRKNLDRIIQAFNSVNCDEHLVVVGSRNNIFKAGYDPSLCIGEKIHFTGYISDDELRQLYSGAKLFFFPSLYEGFGIPPIEAQSCGCPVLVSNVMSLPEVCADSAHYCDPLSISDMSEKLIHCLNSHDLKANLIELGYENIKRFSWDESAQQVIEFSREVL